MIIDSIELNEYIYSIKVGNNAKENWDIISGASQNDIWFHLGGHMASPHVVLSIPHGFKLKKIPIKIITHCAALCKQHSKYSNINKVTVIYTEIKNISKGDTIGSVHTKKTSSIVL